LFDAHLKLITLFERPANRRCLCLGCYEMLLSILLFFVLAIPSLVLILTLVHTRCCVIFCSSQPTVLQRHWSDCIDRICLLVCFFIMLSICIISSYKSALSLKHQTPLLCAVSSAVLPAKQIYRSLNWFTSIFLQHIFISHCHG